MAIVVPSTDVPNFNLQAQIANLTTLIANATQALNGPLVLALTQQQAQVQAQLCTSLLGSGGLVGATVISTMSYVAPTPTQGSQL